VTHPNLVRVAGAGYLQQLEADLAASDPQVLMRTRVALEALISSVKSALEAGPDLTPSDVPFTWDLMAKVPAGDAQYFMNQYQLGWGSDGAGLIAVGTEQNFSPDADQGLGALTLDCANQIIWLIRSKPELMVRFGHGPEWDLQFTPDAASQRGPYHVYTSSYHSSRPSGTWQYIGRHLLGGGDLDWRAKLGAGCYQIELKADPAPRAHLGGVIHTGRLRFLGHALRVLSDTATVTLFHGVGTHDSARQLAPAFLGVERLPAPTEEDHIAGRDGRNRPYTVYQANHRRVILTWALNGLAINRDEEYLTRIRDLVSG
jgi:hypothetical protein